MLLDVNGLDRPDIVVNAYGDLLPEVRAGAREHRDTLMREARTQMATGNERQRLRGCRVLVDVAGPGAAAALVPHLEDPSEAVRELAAAELMRQFDALGDAQRDGREGTVHALRRDGWERRLWSAFSSVLVAYPKHGRREFLERLAGFGALAVPTLAKALASDGVEGLRAAMVELLAQSEERASVEMVMALAARDDEPVQRVGVEVLSGRGDPSYARQVAAVVAQLDAVADRVPWLSIVTPVVGELDAEVANALVARLAKCPDSAERTACVEALLRHPDDTVRLAGAKLAIVWRLPDRAALLAPLVGSKHADLRRLAVGEVSKVSFELYMRRFEGMDVQTRKAAARAVAKIDDAILDRLVENIRSLDADSRFKALQIVGYLDASEDLRATLMGLLADPDRHVRATALRIVELTGSVPGMRALIDALSDPDRRVRANAIEAFEDLGDDNYIEIFVPFLGDRDNRVRGNAIKALWNLGYPGAREALVTMLHEDNEAMRLSAVWVIGELSCDGAIELLDARAACEVSPAVCERIDAVRQELSISGGGA